MATHEGAVDISRAKKDDEADSGWKGDRSWRKSSRTEERGEKKKIERKISREGQRVRVTMSRVREKELSIYERPATMIYHACASLLREIPGLSSLSFAPRHTRTTLRRPVAELKRPLGVYVHERRTRWDRSFFQQVSVSCRVYVYVHCMSVCIRPRVRREATKRASNRTSDWTGIPFRKRGRVRAI